MTGGSSVISHLSHKELCSCGIRGWSLWKFGCLTEAYKGTQNQISKDRLLHVSLTEIERNRERMCVARHYQRIHSMIQVNRLCRRRRLWLCFLSSVWQRLYPSDTIQILGMSQTSICFLAIACQVNCLSSSRTDVKCMAETKPQTQSLAKHKSMLCNTLNRNDWWQQCDQPLIP